MSKTNLQVGERVTLIPFKRKGQEGIVKYIGEVEGKNSGNWVGIELDEPKGECDGDCNGTEVFECKAGHGLFLCPTQVRSLVALDEQSAIPMVDESMTSAAMNVKEMFASKLSTTKDVDGIDANFNLDTVEKLQEVVVEHTEEGSGTARTAQAAAAGGGGKVLGWKDRLAALRAQKAAQQQAQEEGKTPDVSTEAAEQDPMKASVQDIFAPAPGLERGKDGKLQVDKAQVPEKVEPVFEKKLESAAAEALG